MNILTACECGWIGIAGSWGESAGLHLAHQMGFGDGHTALTQTNVKVELGREELSILRQVANQDGLEYRAKEQVVNREEFRLRRAGDMMAPLYGAQDDGLGCARGCWTAIKIYGAIMMLGAFVYCSWKALGN